jgi:hypothetical protein
MLFISVLLLSGKRTPSEREVMEAMGEIPPVLIKAKRKRKANKKKE